MAFNGDEGKMIDPVLAQKWMDNYMKSVPIGSIKGEFFGFRRLTELLSQENAIGIRIYYAKDDDGNPRLILVGVTTTEQNIAKIDGSSAQGMVLDQGLWCPPYCTKE